LGVRAEKFKIWSHGTKKNAQKFLYAKLIRYHEAILWSFDAQIVFGAEQVGKIHNPDFNQLGKKIKLILLIKK